MAEPKSGDQLGPFRLVSYLNRGGNAWVWSARGSDGGEVALKILMNRNPDSEPWKRFEREAKLQRDLTAEGFAGILPLLDFHIPQRGEPTRAWLALPVAVSARDAFGAKPNLDDVVASLSTIARTLAQLHERGIAHRDVKPENIYQFENRWVIGDFGLIQVPDTQSLTEGSTGPGSLHYIAPELTGDPDAPGNSADVWSFAKTLWVLATGQRYPPPGELRVDVEGLRLSSYSSDPRASLLDMTIEACTRFQPDRRPSMESVADDLAKWLLPPSMTSVESIDLAAVGREIVAKAAADERLVAREAQHVGAMQSVLAQMLRLVSDIPATLKANGIPVFREFTLGAESYARFLCPEAEFVQHPWLATGMAAMGARREPRGYQCMVHIMVAAARVRDKDELLLGAGYFMAGKGGVPVIWRQCERVIIGSASQERAVQSLADGLHAHLPDAVKAFRDDLYGTLDESQFVKAM
jgi:hypothetical protein